MVILGTVLNQRHDPGSDLVGGLPVSLSLQVQQHLGCGLRRIQGLGELEIPQLRWLHRCIDVVFGLVPGQAPRRPAGPRGGHTRVTKWAALAGLTLNRSQLGVARFLEWDDRQQGHTERLAMINLGAPLTSPRPMYDRAVHRAVLWPEPAERRTDRR